MLGAPGTIGTTPFSSARTMAAAEFASFSRSRLRRELDVLRFEGGHPGFRSSYQRQRNFSAEVPEFTFTSTSKVENKAPSLAIARMR